MSDRTASEEPSDGKLISQAEAGARRLAESEAAGLPPVSTDGPLIAVIQEVARNPNFDVEKLRELRAIQREWDAEQARKAYIAALSRAQATMPVVDKNKHVNFGEGNKEVDYWHADYGHLIETIKPHLAGHGLTYEHNVIQQDGLITVECILRHAFGHSEKVVMFGKPEGTTGMNAIQQVKSTVTYLKRATFEAVTGAATRDDDDDGRGYGAGAVDLITDEQVAEIEADLEELGANRAVFLDYLAAKMRRELLEVSDIPASEIGAARLALDSKRKKLAEQELAAGRAGESSPADSPQLQV